MHSNSIQISHTQNDIQTCLSFLQGDTNPEKQCAWLRENQTQWAEIKPSSYPLLTVSHAQNNLGLRQAQPSRQGEVGASRFKSRTSSRQEVRAETLGPVWSPESQQEESRVR